MKLEACGAELARSARREAPRAKRLARSALLREGWREERGEEEGVCTTVHF